MAFGFLWLLWFPERGIPHNGSFIIENPIKIMNDLGVPPLDMATLASPDRTGGTSLGTERQNSMTLKAASP